MANKMRGLAELQRDLRKLTPTELLDTLLTGLEAGALPLRNEWKEEAPYESGDYKRSIQIVREAERVVVGTDIVKPPYPFYLEFGTRRMHKAHPSARPAVDKTEDAVKRNTRRAVELRLNHLLPGHKL